MILMFFNDMLLKMIDYENINHLNNLKYGKCVFKISICIHKHSYL